MDAGWYGFFARGTCKGRQDRHMPICDMRLALEACGVRSGPNVLWMSWLGDTWLEGRLADSGMIRSTK